MGEITSAVLPEMTSVWQETLFWQPENEQQKQFQRLYELILEGNRQFNLTRITEPEDFWEKHLWDSLRGVMPALKEAGKEHSSFKVIDIGTGAGFPGLPVAITKPDLTVTLLDSTSKKIAFLNTVIKDLQLQNSTALIGRAEEIRKQKQHRQTYDLALIRAVGSASACAEYALPLLKTQGQAILYRGHWTDEETAALTPAVEKLGGAIELIEGFTTPLTQGIRHCIYLRKVSTTAPEIIRPSGFSRE